MTKIFKSLSINKQKKKILYKVLIISLIFIGLIIRLNKYLNFDSLAGDEGIQLLQANHILRYLDIPYAGEVSALDANSEFIIIKPVLGHYFQTILYFLGGLNAGGYVFSYVLINFLIIFFLYKAAKILFKQETAFLVFIMLIFSQSMIHHSVWTSQVVNTLLFESLSVYLYAIFSQNKKNKTQFLVYAFLASFVSIQIYPPVLLLFPGKFILLLKHKKYLTRKHYLTLIIASLLILAPTIFLEIKTEFHNFEIIKAFINQDNQTQKTSPISIESLLSSLYLNGTMIIKFVNETFGYKAFPLVIKTWILISIYILRKNEKIKNLLLFFCPPFLFFIVLSAKADIANDRAYVYIFAIYAYLLIAALASLQSKLIYYLSCLIVCFYGVKYMGDSSYPSDIPNLYERKSITKIINRDVLLNNLKFKEIDLFIIEPGENSSWNGSIYWYLLEEETNQKLAKLDIYSSKVIHKSKNDLKKIYLICENFEVEEIATKCQQSFEERTIYFFEAHYQAIQEWQTEKTKIFAYIPLKEN